MHILKQAKLWAIDMNSGEYIFRIGIASTKDSFENVYFGPSFKNVKHRREISILHPYDIYLKRRPEATELEIRTFLEKSKEIFDTVSHDHIVNCDETFWRAINVIPYTWSESNSDNIIINNDNEKKGFTAVASILRNGETLPIIYIASGTTVREERNWFGGGRNIVRSIEPLTSPDVTNLTIRNKMQSFISGISDKISDNFLSELEGIFSHESMSPVLGKMI